MPEWYLVSSHIKNKNHQIIKKYKIILSTIQDWRPADGILCLHGASLLLHLPVGVRSQLCVRPSARHHFPAGPLQQEADDGGSTTDGWPQHLPHGGRHVHYSPAQMALFQIKWNKIMAVIFVLNLKNGCLNWIIWVILISYLMKVSVIIEMHWYYHNNCVI